MTEETNLRKILQTLGPELSAESFVFSRVSEKLGRVLAPESLGFFREQEGVTLILPRELAEDHQLDYELVFRKITLTVHSSLAAVGLLAEVTRVLAARDVPVNVISGYAHDHLFILEKDVEAALKSLEELSERANQREEQ
jgi:hypothetical protein